MWFIFVLGFCYITLKKREKNKYNLEEEKDFSKMTYTLTLLTYNIYEGFNSFISVLQPDLHCTSQNFLYLNLEVRNKYLLFTPTIIYIFASDSTNTKTWN